MLPATGWWWARNSLYSSHNDRVAGHKQAPEPFAPEPAALLFLNDDQIGFWQPILPFLGEQDSQNAALKYLFQVLGDDAAIHIEKLADGFLRQPDCVVLHPYLDAFFMGVFRKEEEVHCAVADLRFIFWHCVSAPLVPYNLAPELQGRPLGRLLLYSEGRVRMCGRRYPPGKFPGRRTGCI